MAIVPDYQRELGYNRDYMLTGEDYAEIGSKRRDEYQLLLEETTMVAQGRLPEQKQLS
jgi:hypothetical protein